jgi:16S rRNA (guanine527-N7)-methyltransferase
MSKETRIHVKQSVPEASQSGRDEFAKIMNASREAISKLDRYAELLNEWNQRFNLVAESTLPHVWSRHFLDSAQLIKHIPEGTKSLADLGSGAGFPGLVLSVLGVLHVHLIESIGKKANFLRAVIDDLNLDATVHQTRIEDKHDMKFDVITARALKPLPQLLELSKPLIKKESLCLFLKGQQHGNELTESAKYWRFDHETFPSLSDRSGCVLKITNLRARAGNEKNAARRNPR